MRRQLRDVAQWLRQRSTPQLRCSFCGRDSDEVGQLVAGPTVYICDACIKACVAVLEQHGGLPPSPPAHPR